MKKLLTLILCASIITPSFAFADNKSEKKGDNDSRKSVELVQKTEKMENVEKIEKNNKQENVTTEKKNKGEEKKAQKQIELAVKRLNAAIARVQRLSDRVAERLNKLEKEGYTVTASRAYLAEAKVKLDDARAKVEAIKTASLPIVASTATSTEVSVDTTTTPATVTPKQALKNVQAIVKDITKVIQSAHNSVARAISSIKPGQNKPTHVATSTTAITATTTSTSTATTADTSVAATVTYTTTPVVTDATTTSTTTN
ncbi:MAG: hypothetical protein HZB10_02255 [Candidatus Yonathbacteria bacterium]|nr:hypothetical protein [Candidatus Yonathbacteria bacterium]